MIYNHVTSCTSSVTFDRLHVVAAIFFFDKLPKIAYYLYTAANWICPYAIAFDVLALPFALSRRARRIVGIVIYISSYVFGLILWSFSVGMAWMIWGYTGLFIGLIAFGVGVVPVAFLAALVNAQWKVVVSILIGLVLTFGARLLGIAMQRGQVPSGYQPSQASTKLSAL
jgi:hypothetical protein